MLGRALRVYAKTRVKGSRGVFFLSINERVALQGEIRTEVWGRIDPYAPAESALGMTNEGPHPPCRQARRARITLLARFLRPPNIIAPNSAKFSTSVQVRWCFSTALGLVGRPLTLAHCWSYHQQRSPLPVTAMCPSAVRSHRIGIGRPSVVMLIARRGQ